MLWCTGFLPSFWVTWFVGTMLGLLLGHLRGWKWAFYIFYSSVRVMMYRFLPSFRATWFVGTMLGLFLGHLRGRRWAFSCRRCGTCPPTRGSWGTASGTNSSRSNRAPVKQKKKTNEERGAAIDPSNATSILNSSSSFHWSQSDRLRFGFLSMTSTVASPTKKPSQNPVKTQ